MARRKQTTPTQRINSDEPVPMQSLLDAPEKQASYSQSNGHIDGARSPKTKSSSIVGSTSAASPQAGILQLVICVGGIYASFLTWGLLQERITTTPYHKVSDGFRPATPATETFRFPIFLNTIQAIFAFVSGSLYLLFKTSSFTMVPSKAVIRPLLLISLTTTLASPFGYASLSHVDYLTFVLAKSCKLLPVMFLHVAIFRKRYPLSKYLIVLAVTAGVATFTLYHPPKPGKPSSLSTTKKATTSSVYGLTLLGINLLFDGLTNTVQDHVFKSPQRYGQLTGPQMMVVQNLCATIMMSLYLVLTPYIPSTILTQEITPSKINELSSAISFLQRHPSVLYDVLGFAACGAVGQLFIFATLERFSSLLLVTVTVTRKMLTMVLSVMWYGKSLTKGQWVGVALVFGGIGTEAWIAAQEKKRKDRQKKSI